jgi:hypothetical protein
VKATLAEDMIVSFGGDTEIGALPKGIGLERLRWDGQKLVDLDKVSEIWVRSIRGVFELHAVEVPGSQLVAMRYQDRKRLYVEGGLIRLRTVEEMEALRQAETDSLVENRTLKTEALAFVSGVTYSQIDAHIDAVFGNLNATQKGSLKRLYKAVLFVCKREIA